MAITPCFDPTTGASGGAAPAGGAEPVQPPAATSQSVAAGGAYATVTFGAFTDPDGVISSYSASQVNANGSTTWAGTGLGAYTASGAADGDNTGGITPTSGSGLVYAGGNAMGTTTAAYDWVAELASTWDNVYALNAPVAVHFVLTGVTYPGTNDDGIFSGIGSTTAHNSGNSRGWYLRRDAVATNEDRRVRVNSSNSSIIDTVPIVAARVLTIILVAGTIVQVMDTAGATPPAPAIGGATTYSVGCASLAGYATTNPYYVPNAYAYLSMVEQAAFTCTRILVQRYQ